jgi:hypothetical protein
MTPWPDFAAPLLQGATADQSALLQRLRQLILTVPDDHPRVGRLVESLKWGDLAFTPDQPRIGTAVRLNRVKSNPHGVALYVHCKTSLADQFRQLYPNQLTIQGQRALLFDTRSALPDDVVRHCAQLALSYFLR